MIVQVSVVLRKTARSGKRHHFELSVECDRLNTFRWDNKSRRVKETSN